MENCKQELISRKEKTAKSNFKRNLLVTAAQKLVMSLHYATEIEKIFFAVSSVSFEKAFSLKLVKSSMLEYHLFMSEISYITTANTSLRSIIKNKKEAHT